MLLSRWQLSVANILGTNSLSAYLESSWTHDTVNNPYLHQFCIFCNDGAVSFLFMYRNQNETNFCFLSYFKVSVNTSAIVSLEECNCSAPEASFPKDPSQCTAAAQFVFFSAFGWIPHWDPQDVVNMQRNRLKTRRLGRSVTFAHTAWWRIHVLAYPSEMWHGQGRDCDSTKTSSALWSELELKKRVQLPLGVPKWNLPGCSAWQRSMWIVSRIGTRF